MANGYLPIFEVTRGGIVESVHFGAAAVVDSSGRLLAWYGDPKLTTFMRSSAKPFQALPFIEAGGDLTFHLTSRELAILCASHDGTDEHVEVIKAIQAKVGVQESDLLCGTHLLSDLATVEAMRQRGEVPTQNRHNCSGKHTGMLAFTRMKGLPKEDYTNPSHPIQQEILGAFAAMCALPIEQVEIGIDGCSAPNFAVPLYNAALGLARLCDPQAGDVEPPARRAACNTIVEAMTSHPDMVGGPDSFDTHLMGAAGGRILAKSGAEGYYGIGLRPGALGLGSLGAGVALKVSDGDAKNRVRPAVALEILRQLGVLDLSQLERLAFYGPVSTVHNWRKLQVGQARPCFVLSR